MTKRKPGSFPLKIDTFAGQRTVPTEMPLGDWMMIANGRIYQLSLSQEGGVFQTHFSSGDVVEFDFNGSTRRVTFTRVLADTTQTFTGYLFFYAEADTMWRMAGTYVQDDRPEPTSGWYATLPR